MIDDKLIYDVGAHKGEDTELYLKVGFKVVSVWSRDWLSFYRTID
jgi:hypothetical protein